MAQPLTYLLGRLRRLSSPPEPATDADLLDRFARLRDEEAFAALVSRHGPMVLGACRRVLGDAHAAEDACQAVFLVLARKAGSVRQPDALAGWLYGVAYRVALKARGRRRGWSHESLACIPEPADRRPDPLAELTARDLLAVLEQEVQQLPEPYRLPVVLCCLEGLSQEETAQRLGCTPASLRGRLERGRKRLHERLRRRGLSLSAALGVAETARGAAVGVPGSLVSMMVWGALAFTAGTDSAAGVSPRVVALARGGLQTMSLAKLRVALVVLAIVGLAGAGGGWLAGPGKEGPAMSLATAAQSDSKPTLPSERKEKEVRDRQADLIERARAALDRLVVEAEKADLALSDKVVEARQRLVELEERLREAEEQLRANRLPSSEEVRLQREEKQIESDIDRLRNLAGGADVAKLKGGEQRQQQLEKVRRQLRALEVERIAEGKRRIESPLTLRKEMVRQEENIRLLERKRAVLLQASERKREAVDRIRQLEGGRAAEREGPSLRTVLRKLEAIHREVGELKQEVQRLRDGRKK
jgi:RNA polymerase sigma factor (sigma-70 family)